MKPFKKFLNEAAPTNYEAEQSFLTIPLNIEIPQSQTDFNLGLMFRESLEEDTGDRKSVV